MNDGCLADKLRSIRGRDFCHARRNQEGISNKIILGRWENSELELIRPPATQTWEHILDSFQDQNGVHVILVGQSHGGARFAGMVANQHWRWGGSLETEPFFCVGQCGLLRCRRDL